MRARLTIPVGRPVYGLGEEAPTPHDPVGLDEEAIEVALRGARRALAARDFPSVQATVAALMKDHGLPESASNALAFGILEANVKLFEEMQRRTSGLSPVVLLPELPVAPAAPSRPPLLRTAAKVH